MPTATANFGFKLPIVGADANEWGGYLNGNWDLIDTKLKDTNDVIEEFKKKVEEDIKTAITEAKTEVKTYTDTIASDTKNELIPIGFIYTQYPGMKTPEELKFPGSWLDVTNNFAGAFFRAAGGNAQAFENQQNAQKQGTAVNGLKVGEVGEHKHTISAAGKHQHLIRAVDQVGGYVAPGDYSDASRSAAAGGSDYGTIRTRIYYWSGTEKGDDLPDYYLGIHTHSMDGAGAHGHTLSSTDETRPVNYTIRIWQRSS